MNNSEVVTVKDLYKYLQNEIKAGHANYQIFISKDEEGNGFHALFYLGKTPADMDEEERETFEDLNEDLSVLSNTDEAVYLG